jgi:hypothetical protein
MKATNFNRRDLLKMSAFASAAAFFNFGGTANETSAQTKPLTASRDIASFQDEEFVRESRRRNFETRRFALAEMDKLKLAYAPSHANFFWLKVGASNRDLPARLAKSNIYIAGLNP